MKKTVLRKYAALIVKKGANIVRGQDVMVFADLDQPEFVRMVVEEAYRAGAAKVSVEWSYQPLEKLNIQKRSQTVLSRLEKWEVEKWEYRADRLPAVIYLESSDPDGLAGINQSKYAKAMQARMKIIKPIRDRMENKYQWVIAAVPGKAWAKKVFPEERPARAIEHLWEVILKASRADGDDPVRAWDGHNADLSKRCGYLNSLGLESLEIKSSNGTDVKIGLIPDALFMGGAEAAMGSGIVFNPNIPSEEVFVSPKKGSAEGTVYSSKPFSYRGQLIEHFCVKFENGRAVSVEAGDERQTEILRQMIAMDEGASFLGEVALVPYTSPIRETGILFFNTLFDENAACHLALGRGFSNCLRDYEKYSLEETKEKGINDSVIHEDFMIGTADTSIVGVKKNGERVQIFKDGEWAF
ncbi:MAG: aminopeptidase [Firmicutes bacterium]|nr:aminopeptidase [Bacillota bacterium]